MTDSPLEHRVATLEDRVDEHADSISNLNAVVATLKAMLIPMQADIATLKEGAIRSDAARERQTEILGGKIDEAKDRIAEVNDRAYRTLPVWATWTLTLMGMLAAAMATAFFTR